MLERRTSGWDLWEDAPCGLLIAAPDGTVLRANATLSRWLGYELAELIDHKRFPDLMPIGARVFLQTHWTPLLQMQGSVSEVQLDLLHKDGRRVPMMLSAIRRQRNGALQDEIAVLMAGDRKLFERELIAARAKAEAAAGELELAQSRLRLANAALAIEDCRKDEFLAPANAQHDGASVVIVDDNVDAAETLAAAMEMLGYRTIVSHTGLDALHAIGKSLPEAAVLDIGLPDMNGYELAKAIRRAPWGRKITLVAATGWGQDSDKQAAKDAGFDLHFTKPLDFMALDRQLRTLIAGA